MTWQLPTLLHHRHNDMKRQLNISIDAPLPVEHHPDPVATCHCGRVTTHDMLTDIRSLSPTIRTQAQLPPVDFICDACLETIFREGRITHHDFYGALGADLFPDVHQKWKAYATAFTYPHGSHAHTKRIKDGLHPHA